MFHVILYTLATFWVIFWILFLARLIKKGAPFLFEFFDKVAWWVHNKLTGEGRK
jgi:hypothetical protein